MQEMLSCIYKKISSLYSQKKCDLKTDRLTYGQKKVWVTDRLTDKVISGGPPLLKTMQP